MYILTQNIKVNVKFKPVSRQNVLLCTVVHNQDRMKM